MSTLSRRLIAVELRIEHYALAQGELPEVFQGILDELKAIAERAAKSKNYEILGREASVAKRLAVRLMSRAALCPAQVIDYLQNFALDDEDRKDLFEAITSWDNQRFKGEIVDAMVDNLIRTEACYTRNAESSLVNLIKHTERSGPIVRLLSVIAQSNTADQSGPCQILKAVKEISNLKRLSNDFGEAVRNDLKRDVEEWLIQNDVAIGASIMDGEVNQWVSSYSIEHAEQLGLKSIAQALLMRQESFSFGDLSLLAQSGIYTDNKHLQGVLSVSATNTSSRGAVVAYAMLYLDALPNGSLDGNIVRTLLTAAELLEGRTLTKDQGLPMLGEFVARMGSHDDVSLLMESSLHKALTSFSKYRGRMLENDLGM